MNTQSDQIKGHAKSVTGIVTGNTDLQAQGDAETRTADAAARIDHAKEQVADVVENVMDKLDASADKAKDALHAT